LPMDLLLPPRPQKRRREADPKGKFHANHINPPNTIHHMIEYVSDIVDLIALRQALNNPRSSMELNNWMDSRMEAFTSVNSFLRDMLDKAESKISTLEEKHTKAELEKIDLLLQLKNAELKHENQMKNAELKHENQMKNAMIELKDAELKHEKEISAYKLELEKSKNMMERAVWEATQNPK